MNGMNASNNVASGNTGSAATAPGNTTGQAAGGGVVFDYEKAYKELEVKMGTMGQELGEYRTFFGNISPLLERLDQNPELVQAIIDNKIDKSLAKAVAEGRITVNEAAVVSQADQQVRSEVGQKVIDSMSPEKIAQMVEAKAAEIRKDLENAADQKTFEEKTQKFIETTADFAEYAEAIDKWLDEHDVSDIEVAYYAVKGKMSESKAKEAADAALTQRHQEIAANAVGGGNTAQYAPDGVPMIDKLVAGPVNPIF